MRNIDVLLLENDTHIGIFGAKYIFDHFTKYVIAECPANAHWLTKILEIA